MKKTIVCSVLILIAQPLYVYAQNVMPPAVAREVHKEVQQMENVAKEVANDVVNATVNKVNEIASNPDVQRGASALAGKSIMTAIEPSSTADNDDNPTHTYGTHNPEESEAN